MLHKERMILLLNEKPKMPVLLKVLAFLVKKEMF